MQRSKIRLGDVVTYDDGGYLHAEAVVARIDCDVCGQPALMTHSRVMLDADGSRVHADSQADWDRYVGR